MMNEINKTLFIPLFGKAFVSHKGIILYDQKAEEIWTQEAFALSKKSQSKWLAYFMAMRAKVFDNWTNRQLVLNPNALVLHLGCGLDSRCLRVKPIYKYWIDADFSEVISLRKKYFKETSYYHMVGLDVSNTYEVQKLPNSSTVIVILEGLSMYLNTEQLYNLLCVLQQKYETVHLLMDVYTPLAAKISKYKNPIREVGVNQVYGMKNIDTFLKGTGLKCTAELSLCPDFLISELGKMEKNFFKTIFSKTLIQKIYRLYVLESEISNQ